MVSIAMRRCEILRFGSTGRVLIGGMVAMTIVSMFTSQLVVAMAMRGVVSISVMTVDVRTGSVGLVAMAIVPMVIENVLSRSMR